MVRPQGQGQQREGRAEAEQESDRGRGLGQDGLGLREGKIPAVGLLDWHQGVPAGSRLGPGLDLGQ